MTRLLRRLGCLVLTAAVVAGCTHVRTGAAIKDPAVDPDAANPALLDPGHYPRTPQAALGAAGTPQFGAGLESHRIGDNTLLPFQVDPALTRAGVANTGPFIALGALSVMVFPRPLGDALGGHNFLAGFVTEASTDGPAPPYAKDLINLALRFATTADATAAAADLSTRGATVSPLFTTTPLPTRPIPVPRHRDTAAITYPGPEQTSIVWAFTPHGPYVLAQSVTVTDTPDAAAALAAATLDRQLPMIDTLAPTPADQLAALPVDPTGLLARTVPTGEDTTVTDGSFGPQAVLVFLAHPTRSQDLFTATGVDVVTHAHTAVYRARDDAGAQRIVDDFTAEVREQRFTPVGAVTGLPGARCLRSPADPSGADPTIVYCVAAASRYAFEASGTADGDVHQLVAAQYLMLTAP